MARSKKMTITNNRKCDVQLSPDLTIGPLESINISNDEAQLLLKNNIYVAEAFKKRFLTLKLKTK